MDRLLLHLLLLGWASVAAAGWLTSQVAKRLLTAGLLACGNLVTTGLLVAAWPRLGEPAWFLRGSLLLAGATGLLAWRAARRSGIAIGDRADPPTWRRGAFAVSLAPFAAASLLTAYHYAPNPLEVPLPFNPGAGQWLRALAGSAPPPSPDPGANSDPRTLFATDLVLAADPRIKVSDGLQPTEGASFFRNLPFVRWARQPSIQLTLAPSTTPAHLRLSFSVGLQRRETAILEILFNGRAVRQCRLTDAATWLDQTIEVGLEPGENIIEFRDVTPDREPDWLEYLERYPDVKQHLIANNFPLEQGAREHYEDSGRSEGRTLRTRAVPGPEDSRYFMFRRIRLEGFKSP